MDDGSGKSLSESVVLPDQVFEDAKREFREFYTGESDRLHAAEKAFRNLLTLLLNGQDFPEPKVTSRIKDWNECIKKFDGKYRAHLELNGAPYKIKEHISDLIGTRVVCIYESDIDQVSKLLRDHFEVIGETNKTEQMERAEGSFGYKGLHFDLKLNDTRSKLPEYSSVHHLQFEVQIRTIVQDAWSEVDHKLKYKKQTPTKLRRRILRLAALFELADQEFETIRDLSTKLENDAVSTTSKIDEDTAELDLFGFIRVSSVHFPKFVFGGEALDGLLADIELASSGVKVVAFRKALTSNLPLITEYFDYMKLHGYNNSPYTMIRHALYVSDKDKFKGMIFENHKRNFERWLEYRNKSLKVKK